MNKVPAIIGVGLAALVCASAHASDRSRAASDSTYDSGLYFGVSAGEFIYKEDGLDTMRPTLIEARLGQRINRYFALEGRIGGGLNSDDANGYSTRVQMVYAGYAKGILPLAPSFSVYGLGGIAGTQLHHNYPDFNRSDAGLSFGVGAELSVAREASLTLEWVRLNDGYNAGYHYTADQATFGVNFRF